MEYRYKLIRENSCRDYDEYIQKTDDDNRHISIFIDEVGELLNNSVTEQYLIKILQKGRTAGMHLVLSTQRSDEEIHKWLIKTNFPSRICFRVASKINSRYILDVIGAEELNAEGDALIIVPGLKIPSRVKTPYISMNDIRNKLPTKKK